MMSVTTRNGKDIVLISASELCDPHASRDYVRAYCHIHGSDHQRSLSINRATGWGRCFNAACGAIVLVVEWNVDLAARLAHFSEADPRSVPFPAEPTRQKEPLLARQLVLLHPPREIPAWQQDELTALRSLDRYMRQSLSQSCKARRYLQERHVTIDAAVAAGVGYLPATVLSQLPVQERQRLCRWTERILFPLRSWEGEGYIGRSLWGWRPGMDENTHKALLDREEGPRRWIKTNPAGCFRCDAEHVADRVVVVEGGFDRLALLSAGFARSEVIALAGTSMSVDLLPPQVRSVVLALDGDQGGHEASTRLTEQLTQVGLAVTVCLSPQDRWGKDWNERWRTLGIDGVRPLLDVFGRSSARTRSA